MKKRGYIIHVTKNRYFLVKILNEYNSKSEANNSLVKLLSGKVTERKLLKDYNKKESF